MSLLSEIIKRNNLSIEVSEHGTDKGFFHSYIDNFYQPLFNLFDKDPETIFELGIQYKASLALWKLNFPSSFVSGCDIDLNQGTHSVAGKLISSGDIHVSEGDAYVDTALIPEQVTLLIDDGPHTIESQLRILSLKHKLSENGILVIEDIGDLGGPIYCFKALLGSVPRSERKKCICLDFSNIGGRWDDAIFVYSNDRKLVRELSISLKKFQIPNNLVSILLIKEIFFAKVKSIIARVKN